MPKVLELQLHSINPSNEYLGLISFRIDWFDLLVVIDDLPQFFRNTEVSVEASLVAQIIKNPPALWETWI